MAEHTPGPWTTTPHQFGGCWWVHTLDGDIQVSGGCRDEENARLISAAPGMLEALVAIRDCTFVDRERALDTPCHDCIDQVDAAIAKARGET